jgi:7-carboxy-7-deazaguanine synthase
MKRRVPAPVTGRPRTVRVLETFVSLQGESTYAGLPCFFIRLAGCNLACRYCDTPAVNATGAARSIARLAAEFARSRAAMAEITGGEPLLQPGFPVLAAALRDAARGRPVLVETNGSRPLSLVPRGVTAIMDVKCPGSGEARALDAGNLARLRSGDEVKFVVATRADFVWAAALLKRHRLDRRCRAVLFSPVRGKLEAAALGRWILAARLPARLQVQLHKAIGMR